MVPKVRSYDPLSYSHYGRLITLTTVVLQPKSRIGICSSHTKVSLSQFVHPTKKKRSLTKSRTSSIPLLNIVKNNVSTARHGLSTSRKLGIAFGSILGVGFFAGLLIFLYLILHHRLRARSRTRSWKRHLNLRKLYLDSAASHHHSKKNVSNTTKRPHGGLPVTTMVGSEEESSSLNGGEDRDTLTPTDPDPFAVLAVDFTIPPLETSYSTTPTPTTPTTSDVRRGREWRNFEDYDFI